MIQKIAEILRATKHPLLKTVIVQKCNTSNIECDRYLHFMVEHGLLDACSLLDLRHISGPQC